VNDIASFDYVIVGGGSAGCVLANRLSEDPDVRVLVLEAGKPDKDWLIHVPLGVGKVWRSPKHNWDYISDPEPHADNREIWHPRGKVVGGSSSINMMAYVRGHRGDYDRWRQMGLTGWSYAEVLPYFKRLENFAGGGDTYRGDSGSLRTRITRADDEFHRAYLAAGKAAGYPVTEDFNGARQEGFASQQFNVAHGRRYSAARAFLHPALKRPNVSLRTEALVARVIFEGTRAIGVAFKQNGQEHQVRAERDIILSGGAYNSPHLLMLSGVGPADHLVEHGIPIVADRAGVGQNLQDHPGTHVEYAFSRPTDYIQALRFDRLAVNMMRAWFFGSGPAAIPPGAGTAFLKSDPAFELPDLQFFFRPLGFGADMWFPVIKPHAPEGFTFRGCQLRPESRGEIRLASSDPFRKARVLNNFLSTETDRKALRDCVKIMREVISQAPFDPWRGAEILPGPDVKTDAEIDAFVRQDLGTIYHPVGTCRMGPDDASVVDLDFRVRGIEGLRVIDASVMPDLVGGNINAPVMMMADKASDIIRGKPPLPPIEV